MPPGRGTYPEQEPNDSCGNDQAVECRDYVDPCHIDPLGDRDWYVFWVEAGDSFICGTTPASDPGLPTTDTYIELYADDCVTVLAYDDDSGPGAYSLITDFEAPYTGSYHLMVRSYGDYYTGCYMVFFDCGTPMLPPDNNTCGGAEQAGYFIERFTSGSLGGDTRDCLDNYGPTNDCTDHPAAGRDMVYYMDLEQGDYLDMTYAQQIWDASLYVLADCSDMNSCIAGADAAYVGDPENLTCTIPATGRYYLILDARSAVRGGPWTLDYTIDRRKPCCFADGTCQLMLEVECLATEGEYRPDLGEACDPNPCPQPLGACCLADGSCSEITNDECTDTSGVLWTMFESCNPNPCTQPGACCFDGGECLLLLPDICADLNGEFLGESTPCQPNPCTTMSVPESFNTREVSWGRIKTVFR